MKVILKIHLQIRKISNRILFFLRYPYISPSLVLGLSKMKLPMLFSAGRGLKLIVLRDSCSHVKQIEISNSVWIGENVELNTEGDSRILIHEGTSIQDRCKIIGNVTIYRNVIFAPNVFISSGTHHAFYIPYLTIREQDSLGENLNYSSNRHNVIEEDCWIGINSYIKPGVYIGRGVVVGANSVISKDVPPYSVVVGANKYLSPRLKIEPATRITNEKEFTPYRYRGYCSKKQFWLSDNLSIVKKASYKKVKITFDSCYKGKLNIHLSSNKYANVSLKESSLSYVVELFESNAEIPFIIPQVLEGYECFQIRFEGLLYPQFKELEFYE